MQRSEATQPQSRDAIDLRIIGGLGLGAALMYFLDPAKGARRRSMVRDKLVHAVHVAEDALGTTGRDLGNRTRGAAAAARSRLRPDYAGDEIIVQRVRAELGRVVSHPSAIIVTADDGYVVLSGQILEDEADRLLARARKVRGVAKVEDRLERHASGSTVPALQGGRPRRGGEFELLQDNWTPAARLFAGAAGGFLAMRGARRKGVLGTALSLGGLALLSRGATNTEIRRLLGGGGRRAVDVRKTINIGVPVDQVYTFFTDYENWPRLMSHVREVRDLGNGRSHWTVDGPAGTSVEWDAEITRNVPNEVLAWRSVEGSPIRHAGVITLRANEDGSTRVDIRMTYNPPAGAIGHTAAVLFGVDPRRQMNDDLVRVKTALETGKPPRDAAQPAPDAGVEAQA